VPLLNISTNKEIKNEQMLLSKSSELISSLLNKSEDFVMVKLTDSLKMFFSGTNEPCCFIEIKSIGSIEPSTISKPMCEFFSRELDISKERIYIFFQNVDPNMWAWNTRTFG
tara:strand:+ start:390 stop:725 length:336 start_codon:yes stop_codon:yes gene_type:complete